MKKYEIVEIGKIDVSLDLSIFRKTEELWFSATDVAKQFDKRPADYLKTEPTEKYLKAVESRYDLSRNQLVKVVRGGKYQGTYLHKLLAFDFCRWCSPEFAVDMDKFLYDYIADERVRKAARNDAALEYRPMTDLIKEAHDPIKSWHYSNEADMINKIVLGMKAKQYKELNNIENVRDNLCAQELLAIKRLQVANTGMLDMGEEYDIRKEKLEKLYKKKFSLEAING